jgi:DNA-binding NarL/FixJ family response regulator
MIHLLLVDDHGSFCQSFAFTLQQEADIMVVGQARSLAEARRFLATEATRIDIAIVDLALPDGDGAVLASELRAVHPEGQVLVLTAATDPRAYARAVEAGAAGVLHKSVLMPEIVRAVRRLAAKEQLLSPQDVIHLLEAADHELKQDQAAQRAIASLTLREREVLQAFAECCSDKDIAKRLRVSLTTVRTHVANIYRKLDVTSRLEAVLFGLRHGLIELN